MVPGIFQIVLKLLFGFISRVSICRGMVGSARAYLLVICANFNSEYANFE